MVDVSNVKFPITMDKFVRIQREEMHRPPDLMELELYRDVVDMSNKVYHAAAEGDSDTAEAIFAAINGADSQDPVTHKVAAFSRFWAVKGLWAGMKALKQNMNATD